MALVVSMYAGSRVTIGGVEVEVTEIHGAHSFDLLVKGERRKTYQVSDKKGHRILPDVLVSAGLNRYQEKRAAPNQVKLLIDAPRETVAVSRVRHRPCTKVAAC